MVLYNNPVKINYLSLDDFTEFIGDSANGKTIGLVLNSTLAKKISLDFLVNKIKNNSHKFIWIDIIKSNPTVNEIKFALDRIGDKDVDILIAIGGGSSIDLGKSCIALNKNRKNQPLSEAEILDIVRKKDYLNYPSNIPLFAVPTTAGSGSEMTKWGTIWDPKNNKKYSIEAEWLYPDTAFLIPELTYTLPPHLTISTSLDALTQACEAFWAKASSPLIKELAFIAIRIIKEFLPLVKTSPKNHHIRSKLLIASSTSGLAFSQTKTTACHSISYPLTNLFKIPHGIAVALTLDEIMHINIREVPEINEIVELFSNYGGLKNWLSEVTVPHFNLNLSSFGIIQSEIPFITDQCYTKGRMDNNPVNISKTELTNILLRLL